MQIEVGEYDMAYIRLREAPVAKTVKMLPVLIDVDADGVPIGIEVLGWSQVSMKTVAEALEKVWPQGVVHAA